MVTVEYKTANLQKLNVMCTQYVVKHNLVLGGMLIY